MPKEIVNIDNHYEQALARLPDQYVVSNKVYLGGTQSGWDGILNAFTKNAQTLEDIMQSMLEERGLDTAEGVNLDRIGQIVGEDRLGRSDDNYRLGINGKISENNSNGTEQDVMSSVRRFAPAESYNFYELPIAKFRVTLNKPTAPVDARLYKSVDSTKVAGVGYSEFTVSPDTDRYFGFSNDPHPDSGGFATIPRVYSFVFRSDDIGTTNRIKADPSPSPLYLGDPVATPFGPLSVVGAGAGQRLYVAGSVNYVETLALKRSSSSLTGTIRCIVYSNILSDTIVGVSNNTIAIEDLEVGAGGTPATTPAVFDFSGVSIPTSTYLSFVFQIETLGGSGQVNFSDSPYDYSQPTYYRNTSGPAGWTGYSTNTNISVIYDIISGDIRIYTGKEPIDYQFQSELQFLKTGSQMYLVDKAGVGWGIEFTSNINVQSFEQPTYLWHLIPVVATITKDGAPSTRDEFLLEFEDYIDVDATTFNTNNPQGILEIKEGNDSQAGNYSTLLLNGT